MKLEPIYETVLSETSLDNIFFNLSVICSCVSLSKRLLHKFRFHLDWLITIIKVIIFYRIEVGTITLAFMHKTNLSGITIYIYIYIYIMDKWTKCIFTNKKSDLEFSPMRHAYKSLYTEFHRFFTSTLTRWTPLCRQHVRINFLLCKIFFDSNVPKLCSQWAN